MKKFFLIPLALMLPVLICGCNSNGSEGLSREDFESYSPVPMENTVLLEIDPGTPLRTIIADLDKYQDAYINSICMRLPQSFLPEHMRELVDSCHRAGINVIVHVGKPHQVKPDMLHRFNIDGYHCTQAGTASPQQWQQIADSLYAVKPMLLIADDGSEALKESGFSSAAATEFTNAIDDVLVRGAAVSHLDSVFAGEKFLFSKQFPALRRVRTEGYDDKIQKAALVTMFAVPGVPSFDIRQITTQDTLLKSLLDLYSNSAVMQYGDIMLYDDETNDIFTAVREFQGKKMLFVVNTRNHPVTYKWPQAMFGSKMELVMGEKLARNGGQELPPYGYQIFTFETIEGFNSLEMREG